MDHDGDRRGHRHGRRARQPRVASSWTPGPTRSARPVTRSPSPTRRRSPTSTARPPTSPSMTARPPTGFGYITTRDGTTLSANVAAVRRRAVPDRGGVLSYMTQQPANTTMATLFNALGFAYVGVVSAAPALRRRVRDLRPVQASTATTSSDGRRASPGRSSAGRHGGHLHRASSSSTSRGPSRRSWRRSRRRRSSTTPTAAPSPRAASSTGFAVPWAARRPSRPSPAGRAWTKTGRRRRHGVRGQPAGAPPERRPRSHDRRRTFYSPRSSRPDQPELPRG